MSFGTIAACKKLHIYDTSDAMAIGTMAFDVCVIISGIVVGALALCGYISLPPAASYAALGAGCGFLAIDAVIISIFKPFTPSNDTTSDSF